MADGKNEDRGGSNSGPGGGNPPGHGGGNGGGNPGQGGSRDEVTIIIDKKKYKSPTPTPGEKLYVLGTVAAGYDLYREDRGHNPNDELIKNDPTAVKLKDGDTFYSIQSKLNPG